MVCCCYFVISVYGISHYSRVYFVMILFRALQTVFMYVNICVISYCNNIIDFSNY